MVKLNKIYTRTGDDGTTGLVDGSRLPKHDARMAAIGAVDEANSALGLAAVVLADGEFEFVRSFTSEAAIVERLREGQLIESVAKEVWAGTQKLQKAKAASGAELNAKFAADGEAFKGEMGFGGTEEFYAGAAPVLQPSPRDAACACPYTWLSRTAPRRTVQASRGSSADRSWLTARCSKQWRRSTATTRTQISRLTRPMA